ncbi:MAG: sugar phosphate isomerase/epimerase [Firmicutes bacterium]|nr:sugar phosphate isomerase/epimerase [Bacillota bacterium]
MKKVISLSPTKSGFGPLLYSGDLSLGLKRAGELGYDGVELSLRDAKELDSKALQHQLSLYNLRVYGIATGQTYYNDGFSLFAEEGEKRLKALERMKGHVDLAAQLGAAVIIGGIRGKIESLVDYDEIFSHGKEMIGEVCRYALDKKVMILLEPINRYETNIINTLAEGMNIIRELGYANLRLLADTFHMNLEEVSYGQVLLEVGPCLGYVHFADSNRLAPGWGHTDFQGIYQTLCEIGFDGPVGIEVLPKPGDDEAAKQGIKFLNHLLKNN